MQTTFEKKSSKKREEVVSPWSVNFLHSQLFSSMLTGSELYLSKKTTNYSKPLKKKKNGRLKKTKHNLLKLLTNPAEGIEKLLGSANSRKNIELSKELNEIQENINQELMEIQESIILKNEAPQESIESKYSSQPAKLSPAKTLRKFYMSFANYGKSSYSVIKTTTHKVVGNIKLTIFKIANTSLYLKASLNPQWNLALGSALDKDTHAPEESSNSSVNDEDAQYQTSYKYLRYNQ